MILKLKYEKILYLLSLLLYTFTLSQESKGNLKGIDEEINAIMKDYQAVGISVAIVENDKVIYSKGYGYRIMK
ncbi:hypothetical protein EJ377_03245 [Chryseobacterium arthrosphaerae]|uniref:Serine hydrolase n=1 Tax=Chryseobacterium arthrosphaerae TaxID=651561 RepID=A0A432DZ28_9FLAO|nr:hypothetical protein EJ377_03245 [Chryseobacterium arthrosphaerae]